MTVDLFEPSSGYTADVTAENLGDLFGVSRITIYNYVKAGMPQKARNAFDLRACVRWMLERASAPASPTEETARAQLNNRQREKVEIELGVLRGELVRREEVREVLHAVGAIIASQLDALGPRVAPFATTWATPAAAQAAILEETNAIRSSVAQALRQFGTPAAEPPPVTKPSRKRRA